jgi:hypothetical protein
MAVGRNVPVAIQVVEQHVLVGQLVVIRRNLSQTSKGSDHAAAGITNDLIVVRFLDDVQRA